jgi:hypothetical protein
MDTCVFLCSQLHCNLHLIKYWSKCKVHFLHMSWFLRSWNQGTEPARTYCAVCCQCSVSSFRYTVCCDTTWSRDQHTSQHFLLNVDICLSICIWDGKVCDTVLTFLQLFSVHFLYFRSNSPLTQEWKSCWYAVCAHITHLRQQYHNSKLVIFQEKRL